MKSSLIEELERQELVQKLREHGLEDLVEVLLGNENVYTKRGRLNKSGACREGGWKTKQLEDKLRQAREILKAEFDD